MSEQSSPLPYSRQELAREITQTLGQGASDAVLLSSAASYMTLDDARQPRDIDLSVTDEHFSILRRRFEDDDTWTETILPDGRPLLTNGLYDIATGWAGGVTHASLLVRSWQARNDAIKDDGFINIANPADVQAQKEARSQHKDREDTAETRRILRDPAHSPLGPTVMRHEIELINQLLPEEIKTDETLQPYIILAASGLLTVFTLYGHPGLRRANQGVGDLEKAEYHVPMLYHNGFHLLENVAAALWYMRSIGASPERQARMMAAIANADKEYCHGRGRDQDIVKGGPWDERRSADLTYAQALRLNIPESSGRAVWKIIDDTGYDEATRQQKARHSNNADSAIAANFDLVTLTERPVPRFPYPGEEKFAIVLEDAIAARWDRRRIFGRVLIENNVRLASFSEAMDAADFYADARPRDLAAAPTVREIITERLCSGANLHRDHAYIGDWPLDNVANRHLNADDLLYVATRYGGGGSFREAYETLYADFL